MNSYCFQNCEPCVFITVLPVFVATHVTSHDVRMTPLNKFTEMPPYSHESTPVTKESVLIRIETQAQSSTEDKADIFSR